jgi:hypothetical protein
MGFEREIGENKKSPLTEGVQGASPIQQSGSPSLTSFGLFAFFGWFGWVFIPFVFNDVISVVSIGSVSIKIKLYVSGGSQIDMGIERRHRSRKTPTVIGEKEITISL